MNPFVLVSSVPTCPPPTPPAPLVPPAFALTGTGPVVLVSALPDDLPFDLVDDAPAVTLRVVPPARSRAAKAPFIALVLGLLGGGLVTLLLINTALSQGAFAVQKLQKTNIALTEQQQQLNKDLADADQPQALASKAVALGMVPGGAPAFLRLPDGKVLGAPKVAVPLPVPTPTVTATPPAAASVTPGATTTPAAPGATTAPVTTAPVTTAVTSAAVTSAAVTTAPAAPTTGTSAGTPAAQGKTATPPTPVTPTKGKP
ncbi:hypothetical protein acdb102_37900 [Acidothermaceae bacterium B102]|nr:hypothetical protein acdb102_37900 [Acidothermaceae bacterium B102]